MSGTLVITPRYNGNVTFSPLVEIKDIITENQVFNKFKNVKKMRRYIRLKSKRDIFKEFVP